MPIFSSPDNGGAQNSTGAQTTQTSQDGGGGGFDPFAYFQQMSGDPSSGAPQKTTQKTAQKNASVGFDPEDALRTIASLKEQLNTHNQWQRDNQGRFDQLKKMESVFKDPEPEDPIANLRELEEYAKEKGLSGSAILAKELGEVKKTFLEQKKIIEDLKKQLDDTKYLPEQTIDTQAWYQIRDLVGQRLSSIYGGMEKVPAFMIPAVNEEAKSFINKLRHSKDDKEVQKWLAMRMNPKAHNDFVNGMIGKILPNVVSDHLKAQHDANKPVVIDDYAYGLAEFFTQMEALKNNPKHHERLEKIQDTLRKAIQKSGFSEADVIKRARQLQSKIKK